MYVGRIVSVGRNKAGKLLAMYRVSSRSFPNRMAQDSNVGVSIVPKPGHEKDIFKNPYIAYNCLRLVGDFALVSNGSHTDPIAEKLEAGMSLRDAIVTATFGLDYEHDHLKTPRITAAINSKTGEVALATIRHDAMHVKCFTLEPGQAFYVATYEHHEPKVEYIDSDFDANTAEEACDYMLGKGVFAELERPITSVCAIEEGEGYATFFKDKEA